MILVNVLMFVAIASSVVMLMISGEDIALHQATRMREGERAAAIAQGGELSAVSALRRDAREAPQSDDITEGWARIGERNRQIAGGTFDLNVSDAQSRFNINQLRDGDVEAQFVMQRIGAAAGLPRETVDRVIELLRLYGPVADLQPLATAGLDPQTMARLADLVTALPGRGRINLNTASEAMLAVLLASPVQARLLVERRSRQGFVRAEDFAELGIAVPSGGGFTSDLFWVRSRVTIGDTAQQLTSLIRRVRKEDGTLTVEAVGRWRGAAAPLPAINL